MEPKRGDIVLSREDTFFSWLIRYLTKSEWSHASLYVGTVVRLYCDSIVKFVFVDSNEQLDTVLDNAKITGFTAETYRDCIVSAVPMTGVTLKPFWNVKYKSVYRVKEVEQIQLDNAVTFALSKIGSAYDYVQCCLLAYRIFTQTLLKNTNDPHPDKFECAELVSESFHSVGIDFQPIVDNVLPNQLATSVLVTKVS